jgi:hypothetical protein
MSRREAVIAGAKLQPQSTPEDHAASFIARSAGYVVLHNGSRSTIGSYMNTDGKMQEGFFEIPLTTPVDSVVRRLGLRLGDPRVNIVRATLSKMTQVIEIRARTEHHDFPYPEPGQPLEVPLNIRQNVKLPRERELADGRVIKDYPTITVPADMFAGVFAELLREQNMQDLADRLVPPQAE